MQSQAQYEANQGIRLVEMATLPPYRYSEYAFSPVMVSFKPIKTWPK